MDKNKAIHVEVTPTVTNRLVEISRGCGEISQHEAELIADEALEFLVGVDEGERRPYLKDQGKDEISGRRSP